MKDIEPARRSARYRWLLALGMLLALQTGNAKDLALTIEVGVSSWLHLAVRDGSLCFLGDARGVSRHGDLKRWRGYHHRSPRARVVVNGRSQEWNMKEPLPLGSFMNDPAAGINRVDLTAAGRFEVSMHPNVENLGSKPPDGKRRDDVIAWNRQEIRLWDGGGGASPYVLRVVLSSAPRPDPRKKAWVSREHRVLHPRRSPEPIALEDFLLDRDLGIDGLRRDRISELSGENIPFEFQDEENLYAQYFGKSKSRLIADAVVLLGEPVLEIAACFTPTGELRCWDNIMYSNAESLPLPPERFFRLSDRLQNRLGARLGPAEMYREYGFRVGNGRGQARWKVWRWSCGDKQIELNTGYEKTAGNQKIGEYIFVRIAPHGGCESRRLSSLSTLRGNLSGTPGRSLIIGHVPMVNQGRKGFCVPAIYSMGLLYEGLNINQYSVHLFAICGSDIGLYLKRMNIPFRREWYEIGYTSKKGFAARNPLIEQYNRRKAPKYPPVADAETLYKNYDGLRKTLDEKLLFSLCSDDTLFVKFKEFVIRCIDRGIPVFWGVHAHSRLIIGYDLERDEIVYRDAWGIKHTGKRMHFCEAFFRTNRCSTVTPGD